MSSDTVSGRRSSREVLDSGVAGARGSRYLVVSTDSHVGPTLVGDLRRYCPRAYLEEFDAFAAEVGSAKPGSAEAMEALLIYQDGNDPFLSPEARAAYARTARCEGLR